MPFWDDIRALGDNPLYRRAPRLSARFICSGAAAVGLAVAGVSQLGLANIKVYAGLCLGYAVLPVLTAAMAARTVAHDRQTGFWDDVALTHLTAAQILLGNLVATLLIPGVALVGLMLLTACLAARADPFWAWTGLLWVGAVTVCASVGAAFIGIWSGLYCRHGPHAVASAVLLVCLLRFLLAMDFAPGHWWNYMLTDTRIAPLHLGTILSNSALSVVLWAKLADRISGRDMVRYSVRTLVQGLVLLGALLVGYIASWRALPFDKSVWRSASMQAAQGCWGYVPPGDNRRARMLDDVAKRCFGQGRTETALGVPDAATDHEWFYRLLHEPRLDQMAVSWIRWRTTDPYLRVQLEPGGRVAGAKVVKRAGASTGR